MSWVLWLRNKINKENSSKVIQKEFCLWFKIKVNSPFDPKLVANDSNFPFKNFVYSASNKREMLDYSVVKNHIEISSLSKLSLSLEHMRNVFVFRKHFVNWMFSCWQQGKVMFYEMFGRIVTSHKTNSGIIDRKKKQMSFLW